MPRYLYLLRHAQSAEKQTGQTDKERELTTRGIRESIFVGQEMIREKTLPDLIICSSSTRTQTTASLVSETLNMDQDAIISYDELYEASTRELLQAVAQFENSYYRVLCVAHNPAISYLAEYLTKEEIGEIVPAGMVIIEFDNESWAEAAEGKGKLVRYVKPDGIR